MYQPPDPSQFEENAQAGEATGFTDETFNLLFKDELQEKALVKALLEHGPKPFDASQTVAEYIFSEPIIEEMIENLIVAKILRLYKELAAVSPDISEKSFIFSQEVDVSSLVVSILNSPYELSEHWQEEKKVFAILEQGMMHYLGTEYKHKPLIITDKTYKDEVLSIVGWLKLKKVKHLLEENQSELQAINSFEKFLEMHAAHQHIKEMEMELTKLKQTVIKKL
jgi:DNA primase